VSDRPDCPEHMANFLGWKTTVLMYGPRSWQIQRLRGTAVEARGRAIDDNPTRPFAHINLGQPLAGPANFAVLDAILATGPPRHYGPGPERWLASECDGELHPICPEDPAVYNAEWFWWGEGDVWGLVRPRFGAAAATLVTRLVSESMLLYDSTPEAVRMLRRDIHRAWANMHAAEKRRLGVDGPNPPWAVLARRREMKVQ
jgi:hypothetical protein